MLSNNLRWTSMMSNKFIYRTMLTDERIRKLYPQKEQEFTDEGYPILKLMPSKTRIFDERPRLFIRRREVIKFKIRADYMKENIDWPSVWPTAKTFSPSAVPLPLRQSFEEKRSTPPREKYANTELIKIPNFLHLTPGAIERHCKALKKFCTRWPDNLDTDEQVRNYFPVTYITRDYVHSSPTIRDSRARIVEMNLHIKDLKLKPKDEDKLIRLARHRFHKGTGQLKIRAKDCPVRVQNLDHVKYLLTALYFESLKHEKWEEDKPECDWEKFFWENSQSKIKVKEYLNLMGAKVREDDIENGQGFVKQYKEACEKVFLNENYENLEAYRLGVEKLLGFNKSQ